MDRRLVEKYRSEARAWDTRLRPQAKESSRASLPSQATMRWGTPQNGVGNTKPPTIGGIDHVKDVKILCICLSDISHKNCKESIGLLLEVKRAILMDKRQKAELLASCNIKTHWTGNGWMNMKLKLKLVELCRRAWWCPMWTIIPGARSIWGVWSALSPPLPAPWAGRRAGMLPEPEQGSCSLLSQTQAPAKLCSTSNHPALQTLRPSSKYEITTDYCKSTGFSLNSSFTVKRIRGYFNLT